MIAGAFARAARGVDPAWFAMVMATGIVSAALGQAGLPGASAVLLAVTVASFVILVAASCWRAVVHPADLRAGLRRPDRAFASFAFVAACGVLGNELAGDGHRDAAAVLAGTALAAWLALTCLVPVRLARPRARPAIAAVNGTWYLWAVATQSLAIAAAFLQADGLLRARLAATAGIAAWSAGVVVYLAVMALVLARLLAAGLGPADATAPYWVAMGAASISTFAAVRILHIGGPPAVAAARPVITGAAVTLWVLATGLIPVLATMTAARWLRPSPRPRYRPQAWAIVFPLGMYALAGLQPGTAARLPLIHQIGAAAVWPAAAAWALTFTAMAASPITRRHHNRRRSLLRSRGGITRLAPKKTLAPQRPALPRPAPAGDAPAEGAQPASPHSTHTSTTVRQDGHQDEAIQIPGPDQAPPAARQRPRRRAAGPSMPGGDPGPPS